MSRVDVLIARLCPDGVALRRLGDVVRIRNGRDYKHHGEGSYPVYGSGGIMMNVNRTVTGLFRTAASVARSNRLTLSGTLQFDPGGSRTTPPDWTRASAHWLSAKRSSKSRSASASPRRTTPSPVMLM